MGIFDWMWWEIFGRILFNQQGDWLICLLAMRRAAKFIEGQCMSTACVLELLVKPHNPQGRSEWSTTWRTKMQNEYQNSPCPDIWFSTFSNLYLFSTNLTDAFFDAILWCTSQRGPGFLDASDFCERWTICAEPLGVWQGIQHRHCLGHHYTEKHKTNIQVLDHLDHDNVSVDVSGSHCTPLYSIAMTFKPSTTSMDSDGHFEGPSHSTPVLADPGLGIDLPVICPVPKKECCDCCMIPLTICQHLLMPI